jgi:hypothetical protein
VEFEVPEDAVAAGMAFKFHITCHAAWQIECAFDEPSSAR